MLILLLAGAAILLAGIRPGRTREWMWAAAGAVLLLVLGREPAISALDAIALQWNVLLFILGLMGLAVAAEGSGAFVLVAQSLLRRAGGSKRKLFVLLFCAGALLTMLLSNDATAIAFTPIVYRAVATRRIDVLPYLLACGFVANIASFGLPFANPANLIILRRPHAAAYLLHLAPAEGVAIVASLALLMLFFRRRLRGTYEVPAPMDARPEALRTLVAICGVALLYLVALAFDVPLGPVAFVGALGALAIARVSMTQAARQVSWSTFVLLGSLFVLLDALDRAGLLHAALSVLASAARRGPLAQIAAASGGAALLANVVNNLPVAVAASHIVARAPHLAYALIAGTDLGPNLTTMGSLSTILWITTLRREGIEIRPLQYLRIGIVLLPATLAVTILWLWLIR